MFHGIICADIHQNASAAPQTASPPVGARLCVELPQCEYYAAGTHEVQTPDGDVAAAGPDGTSPPRAPRQQLGTATPPCLDHAGSAPSSLTGAEVVLFCRMFLRRRIGRIQLSIHASGGLHRGLHRAAVVAYVLLIVGSSKTVVGRTSQ